GGNRSFPFVFRSPLSISRSCFHARHFFSHHLLLLCPQALYTCKAPGAACRFVRRVSSAMQRDYPLPGGNTGTSYRACERRTQVCRFSSRKGVSFFLAAFFFETFGADTREIQLFLLLERSSPAQRSAPFDFGRGAFEG